MDAIAEVTVFVVDITAKTDIHKPPPGRNGNQGPPRSRPHSYLCGGVRGAVHIQLLNLNGTEAIYPSQYDILAVGLEVVDKNGSEINESGERILVPNIYISKVLRDEAVGVPGVLCAFIQQERFPHQMGVKLLATAETKLTGVMPGIDRVLPDFCSFMTINISYLLELEVPRFFNSLKNVNIKLYRICDSLEWSAAGSSRDLDFLDTLDPGTAATIPQMFRLSDWAELYSTGSMTRKSVPLEPGDNQDFCEEVIHQICGCVADLSLLLDIWNMSVCGNFQDPNCPIVADAEHLFYNYMSKSIDAPANPFEYFQRGVRTAFDLLDSEVVSYMTTVGTQFPFPEAVMSSPTRTN
ncbi:hypothetical protein B9Z19DRAFT_1136901 [Tuber borchii]|uniref:Uncharacterized protein n=1 Tax=Tuber borchii TaxID=42251 RepID=A0A2T6ZBC0_TUBBO|nr:hypothetical protein B9Z19DRAFT_1136901 [Tuber borchii]